MVSFNRLFIFCTALALVYFETLLAQKVIERSTADKPSWIHELPSGKYYEYYSSFGSSANTLMDAKKIAVTDIMSQIIMERSVLITSELQTSISEKSFSANGITKTTITDDILQEVIAKGETSEIENLKKVEEYWQTVKSKNGVLYQYWILMRIPKPGFTGFDLSVEQGYGFTPVWKSLLIPGWGQFHKEEPQKGWRFLISETVLVSTFFISNYFSRNYSNKAENERDYDRRKFYNDWSNRSYTIGTVSAIVAGAIYAYNIFDSITSKGARKYAHIQAERLKMHVNVDYSQAELIISINL